MSSEPSGSPADRYHGLGYREMIEWSSRLQREWPLYETVFAEVPERSLLDLGCGPGEHCACFTAQGWTTTGIDVSEAQIADAGKYHPRLEFIASDLGRLEGRLDRQYGAAICVGNVLPNLDDETFTGLLDQLSRAILPGGKLLLHQLEFGPILAGRRRSIGPIFRSDGDRETAFLRIFVPGDDPAWVQFYPTRLIVDPRVDPPVTLDRVESIPMRARRREDLEASLGQAGFAVKELWGGPDRSDHDPETSNDLWLLATR
jgi:SAM-dependent methyltransferase